jgi:glutamyl-tRNA(Gln) amidotransferase subunit E
MFHTDEMPSYGVSQEEIQGLIKVVNAGEQDAVVFVADNPENATDALKAVVDRAREAIERVPEETRAPNPDGTTRYMRPRPGAARMYPETDIPPMQLTGQQISTIKSRLPELPEQKLTRLAKQYGLNEKLARQIFDSEYGELFETIVKETKVSATTVAAFMTETLKALKRERVQVEKISENQIREAFSLLGSGRVTKEALPAIITWLSQHEGNTVEDAVSSIGLKMLSEQELEKVVDSAIERNERLIREKGTDALGAIMGIVMKEVRGKAEANTVSELVRKKLKQAHGKQ